MSHSPWTDATNFLVEQDRVVIAVEGKLRAADFGMGREQALGKLRFDGTDDASALRSVPKGRPQPAYSRAMITRARPAELSSRTM